MKLNDLKRNAKWLAIGAGMFAALLVLPVVSDPVAGVIASIRDKVKSMFGK